MVGSLLSPFSPPLATTLPDSFSPLPLVLIGFSFVVVVLALLALLTFLGGKVFARRSLRASPEGAIGSAPASPPATVDPVTRAVIAAALYTVLPPERVRIGRITRAEKTEPTTSADR